jgi:hypothetical protein
MFPGVSQNDGDIAPFSVGWVFADMDLADVLEMVSGDHGRLILRVRRIGHREVIYRAVGPCGVKSPRGCDVLWDYMCARQPELVIISLSRHGSVFDNSTPKGYSLAARRIRQRATPLSALVG